jgi:hypothetical protein
VTTSAIEREILDLAEEDLYGLWEVGWRLRTVLNIDPALAPAEAAGVIESMRSRHLIEIYVREWVDDEPSPLSATRRDIDLLDPRAWLLPGQGEPQFLVGMPLLGHVDDQ